ncbi:sterol esterase precursor [Phlyctema vagabunda]|uniref:Carboxylic ester hydrolase n=1 Tax=Phlyctema vagabunda TaxID=108571 RepID=A0ABR4PK48_9HELO
MMISVLLLAALPLALAAPQIRAAAPTVTIPSPQATIIGNTGLIETFPGIPFAKPPVGPLRLKPPQAITEPLGTIHATENGKACPQFFFSTVLNDAIPTSALGLLLNTPLFQTVLNAGEDCLYINVHRPVGTAANAKLPVLFWIFGGGFELGWNAMYDGTGWVQQSIAQNKPVIFVTVNYRVGGFGFLGGAEILADGSSNLGLLDQRLGLQWVADNIASFGGDPAKVTIWGESAGAISVFDQMALYNGDHTYKGKPLFRAAIMNSGSVVPADPVDCPKAQKVYDTVVDAAGCSASTDTLGCLRLAPYDTLLNATNSVPGLLSYSSVALSYLPRPDGSVLTQSPDVLATSGRFAKVPFIIGDQEDEGSIFALFQSNITTTAQVAQYLKQFFFNSASDAQMTALVATYPDTTTDGSPFRTGILNNIYPQYKRLAAIIGDLTFTLTRRSFLQIAATVAPEVPSWSYLASYDYGTAVLGTFHGSDLLQVFFGVLPNYASASTYSYYLSFVNTMDPNNGTTLYPAWPQWSVKKQLMQFYALSSNLLSDDFRSDTYDFITANIGSLHI